MYLAQPLWLLIVLALPAAFVLLRRTGYFGHSDVRLLAKRGVGSIWHFVPITLISLAVVSLAVALALPRESYTEPVRSVQSRDILLAVDISGSMSAQFEGTITVAPSGDPELDQALPPVPSAQTLDQPGSTPSGTSSAPSYTRRIDAAEAAVLNFIRDRYVSDAGDRVGLLLFDDSPYWAWPLSRDLKTVYRQIQLADIALGGGTNFGNSPPGPIDAAVKHFDEMGQSSTKVLILVTDGEDYLSAEAKARLTRLLQDRGIHFYVIGVGESLANHDADIIKFAQSVGGQVFRVENADDMQHVFSTINSLEQSAIYVENQTRYRELFWYFAALAVIFLALGVLSQAFVLNE